MIERKRLTVWAVALWLGALTGFADVLYETDFSGTEDFPPADWSVLAGPSGNPGWHIDSGQDYRYSGSGTGITTYTGPLAGGGSSAALTDFTVTTNLRKNPPSGIVGLVGRLVDSGSFYHTRLQDDNDMDLYVFDGGSPTQLGTLTTPDNYQSGEAWQLSLRFKGDQLTARLFDQNNVFQGEIKATDSTHAAGAAGLRAQNPAAYEAFAIKTPKLLVYDGFKSGGGGDGYTPDTSLLGQAPARLGFDTTAWQTNNPSGFAPGVTDTDARSTGLTYGPLQTTPGAAEAYRAPTSGSTSTDVKPIWRDLDYDFAVEDDIWISYLFQFDGLGDANGGSRMDIELRDASANRDLTLQILNDGSGPNGLATLYGGGNSGSAMALGSVDAGETHLLVALIEPSADGPNAFYDAISAWLDPANLADLGVPDATGYGVFRNQGGTLGQLLPLDSLLLRYRPQPAGFSFFFDEFRLGTSAELVLPLATGPAVPEPNVGMLLALGLAGLGALRRRS